jgi:hypothetical protein
MEATLSKTVNRPAAAIPSASPQIVHQRAVSVQTLKVSSTNDPAEKEAESTAKRIMRMSIPESTATNAKTDFRTILRKSNVHKPLVLRSPYIARFVNTGIYRQKKLESEGPKIQRKPTEGTGISSSLANNIQSNTSAASPLPEGVRSFMEPRFNTSFGPVKINTSDTAVRLSNQVNARAFTLGNTIFFGKDQFKPETNEGKELIAHELTHTIQQGSAVQRSEDIAIKQHSPLQVQRLGISDALGYFASKANNIPGFRMFSIVLGVNPINMSPVDRSAPNLLRAVIEFIPGGNLITQALDNHGIIDKVAVWVEKQIATLGMVGGSIKQAIDNFLDSLGWSDIFDLGSVWERAKGIFTDPVNRIINFVKGLAAAIITFIKDAILRPLAKLAESTKGYDLLKTVLGKDPVTGDTVPQTAEALIGGFMKLIGQEEIWNNLKKANAVARAWAWFKGAMSSLTTFVKQIPQLFISAFTTLELVDIILIPRAFIKIAKVFGNFIGQFLNWGGNAVWNLLQIIFEVVAPAVMPYIKKAGDAFRSILKNPVGFVGNLVKAGKQGFRQFATNIIGYLKTALIKWLTGPLGEAGVYMPKSFSLLEIVKLVLSVLGLTWQNIRGKLVKIIPDPVLTALEKTAGILVTLVKDGPAAAWEQIKAELTELKDQLVSQVIQMVSTEIVKVAVIKLVSMLNPAGAIIQAIIAIYNTITFFVQKINQIAAVVASFIDSIAAIAAGKVTAAANKVEQTMANTLTVVISFLAKFIGLGNIPEKLVGVVKKIRKPIDKGLDKIVEWLGNMLSKLVGAAKTGVGKIVEWWKQRISFKTNSGETHEIYFTGDEKNAVPMVASKDPQPILNKLQQYITQAKETDASDLKKRQLPKIDKTKTKLKSKPIDTKAIANDLMGYFNVFEMKSAKKETKFLAQATQNLEGDEVAVHMIIDWLDSAYADKHGSTPRENALKGIMGLMVSEPKTESKSKYIKGHLLNHNLGGEGDAKNMFPITGKANSQHLHSTEKKIKGWIQNDNKKKPTKWIWYEVKVNITKSSFPDKKVGCKSPRNFVNCKFNCMAILKDETGKQKDMLTSIITSDYQKDDKLPLVFDVS